MQLTPSLLCLLNEKQNGGEFPGENEVDFYP